MADKRRDLAVLAGMLEAGQRQGEIRPGDPTFFALAFQGMIMINVLRSHIDPEAPALDDALAAQVIDLFFTGIRNPAYGKNQKAAD
jgi:hypothetical protein